MKEETKDNKAVKESKEMKETKEVTTKKETGVVQSGKKSVFGQYADAMNRQPFEGDLLLFTKGERSLFNSRNLVRAPARFMNE